MEKIIKTYYSILILDSCGDIYDELFKNQFGKEFTDLKEIIRYVLEMKKHDKELGKEYGTWDYRVAVHEETETTDYQSIYKIRKVRNANKYRLVIDWNF